jgi:hypothetical protein
VRGVPGAWPDNPWGHEHPVSKVEEGPPRGLGRLTGAGQGQRRRIMASATMRETTMAT